MNKRLLSVAVVFTAAVLFVSSMAKLTGQEFGAPHPAQKPGSSVIELCAPISTSATISTPMAPVPLGTQIRVASRLIGLLKVTGMPTGGSGQTLDVYFQHSCDDGQTWQDFAHAQVTTTLGSYYAPVSLLQSTTGVQSPTDGTLAAAGLIQGPVGDRLRIKYATNMGTGNSGAWAFHAFVLPD